MLGLLEGMAHLVDFFVHPAALHEPVCVCICLLRARRECSLNATRASLLPTRRHKSLESHSGTVNAVVAIRPDGWVASVSSDKYGWVVCLALLPIPADESVPDVLYALAL